MPEVLLIPTVRHKLLGEDADGLILGTRGMFSVVEFVGKVGMTFWGAFVFLEFVRVQKEV